MTLVIMAAGMGSRFGSFKQIEPVGPNGEFIIDYSIFDAVKYGFDHIVFIINKKIKDQFIKSIGCRVPNHIKVSYIFQDDPKYLYDFDLLKNRTKPLGTAHAILSVSDVIDENFAVINADDFYGAQTFSLLYSFLNKKHADLKYHFCMVGYKLENTLTENGYVSRGICSVDENDLLIDITERTKIQKNNDKIQYVDQKSNWIDIPKNSIVSLNCFGFTKDLLYELKEEFPKFIENNKDDLIEAEFFLPTVVDNLIKESLCDVKVLTTKSRWYGMTYKKDIINIKKHLKKLHKQGDYPNCLY